MKILIKTILRVVVCFLLINEIMDPERKIELKRNVIKFVIWLVLLFFCFIYIQNNPAERVSIFSWFQIIFQKVAVIYNDLIGKNWDLLKRKYSLEKYYKELLHSAEDRKCVSVEVIKKITEEYNSLKNEDISTLETRLPWYSRASYQHEVDIEKWCWEDIKIN